MALSANQMSNPRAQANQFKISSQQYLSLLQLIFPEFHVENFHPREKMMSATQASEVIKNEDLKSMRFALTALRPFISEIEMIYSHLCLGNFPEGL